MIRCQKNLANTIVLIMCMLFCFAIYFEQKNASSFTIELSAEDNSTLECVDSDLDFNEEIQMLVELKYSIMVEKLVLDNHFHFDSKLGQPFYPVWQPPKLS